MGTAGEKQRHCDGMQTLRSNWLMALLFHNCWAQQCTCVWVCVCTCVCACVCVRGGVVSAYLLFVGARVHVSVHVCECLREREREREWECVCTCPQSPSSGLIKGNAWWFASQANENDTVERVLCSCERSGRLNEMGNETLENIRGGSKAHRDILGTSALIDVEGFVRLQTRKTLNLDPLKDLNLLCVQYVLWYIIPYNGCLFAFVLWISVHKIYLKASTKTREGVHSSLYGHPSLRSP